MGEKDHNAGGKKKGMKKRLLIDNNTICIENEYFQ